MAHGPSLPNSGIQRGGTVVGIDPFVPFTGHPPTVSAVMGAGAGDRVATGVGVLLAGTGVALFAVGCAVLGPPELHPTTATIEPKQR